jgi:hypothetical protein
MREARSEKTGAGATGGSRQTRVERLRRRFTEGNAAHPQMARGTRSRPERRRRHAGAASKGGATGTSSACKEISVAFRSETGPPRRRCAGQFPGALPTRRARYLIRSPQELRVRELLRAGVVGLESAPKG